MDDEKEPLTTESAGKKLMKTCEESTGKKDYEQGLMCAQSLNGDSGSDEEPPKSVVLKLTKPVSNSSGEDDDAVKTLEDKTPTNNGAVTVHSPSRIRLQSTSLTSLPQLTNETIGKSKRSNTCDNVEKLTYPFKGYRNGSVPPSESGLSFRNGNGPCSSPRSSLSINRTTVIEEVAPSATSIIDRRDWQVPLRLFTPHKRGKQEEDKNLSRSIRRYYKTQDSLITAFEEMALEIDDAMENAQEQQVLKKKAALLAKITFFCNLFLLIGKAVAAGMTGSLSIISSVIDSVVDLASGALIWWSNHAIKRRNIYDYPQGRTKLEPLAIVVLSVIMALASIQIIREAVERIIDYALGERDGPSFNLISIILCIVTLVVKLVLFLLCRRVRDPSVDALTQDHRNDLLSNTVALACGLIGDKLWVFADPIGATLISIYIIVSWCFTGWEQIKMLTGHTARPDFLKKITWLALNHHHKILFIDTVRAFHFGNNFLVEVDIVLPEVMTLRESHDIGETLQLKIERLPEVERSFVHLDYECEHNPTSEHKQV